MAATQAAVLQADELALVKAVAEVIHVTFFADNEAGNLNKLSEERITRCANYIVSQRVFTLPILGTVTFKEAHFTRLRDLDPHVQSVSVLLYPRQTRYILHVQTIRRCASVPNSTRKIDLSKHKVPSARSANAQWWNLTRTVAKNDTMCSLCVCVSVCLFLWARPLLALTGAHSGVVRKPVVRILEADRNCVALRCTMFVSAKASAGYKIDQEIFRILRSISEEHILSIDVIVEAQAKQHRIVINVIVRRITTSARVDWKPNYRAPQEVATSSLHKRTRIRGDPTLPPRANGRKMSLSL